MSKFCPSCGMELNGASSFCPNCGASLNDGNNEQIKQDYSKVTKRDIAVSIILTIVTCGIYGIYWFVVMTNELNQVSDDKEPSGGMALLLSIVTCGIYSFYWNYKMGQKLYNAGKKYGKDIGDNAVLYLVLSLFGLSIVSYCLIQSDLNKFSE